MMAASLGLGQFDLTAAALCIEKPERYHDFCPFNLNMSSSQYDSSRRRHISSSSSVGPSGRGSKDISTAPEFERGSIVESDERFKLSKVVGFTRKNISAALLILIPWFTVFSLIFGGCCSNVSLGRSLRVS